MKGLKMNTSQQRNRWSCEEKAKTPVIQHKDRRQLTGEIKRAPNGSNK